MDRQRAAWVALALTPGIGPSRLHALVQACHSPLGALSAPFEFLRSVPGVSVPAATAIVNATLAQGEEALERTERLGGQVLVPDDPDYPESFRTIAEPPAVVFLLGHAELLGRPAVAVVGSRDHTPYGADVARAIAWQSASSGAVVVSGMARGLDAVAHHAALDAGGRSIGVLGNGLGVVYPSANRRLYEAMADRGLLLTEFPPGERPHAGSFPRRNRLISALARVTVVVEAAIGSGALITADAALEQGREVMAVPGPITSPQSAGTNRLIRDGATPLLEAEELLAHYRDVQPLNPTPSLPPAVAPLPDALPDPEYAIAVLLGADPASADELHLRSGRPAGEVLAALASLEVLGLVERRAGGRFRRI
ncbi:MAG TPA: DNA-processing protein DprA [Gemmatimonadales bacterium]|nr:DNA-processing protein DprA [Gemmatimonadales bacterium]